MKEEQQENLLTDIPSLVLPSFDNIEGNQREQKELLKEINNNQKAILENQEKLIKYFIPTEEQLKKQELEKKKQLEEEKKLQEELELEEQELQKQVEEEKQEQELYNQQVLQQLTLLNENITGVEFQNQHTNTYLYMLVFGLLFAFVMSFIYKLIKKFMY